MDGRNDMRPTPAKLTYDDFVNFPDDGQRHELIDGEHYVTPSPATVHQRLVGRLYLALGNWLQRRPIGEVFLAPFDVVLSQHDVGGSGKRAIFHHCGSSSSRNRRGRRCSKATP